MIVNPAVAWSKDLVNPSIAHHTHHPTTSTFVPFLPPGGSVPTQWATLQPSISLHHMHAC